MWRASLVAGQGVWELLVDDTPWSLFPAISISRETRENGETLLRNRASLPGVTETLIDRLFRWAEARPNAPFLTEPIGGGRRTLTYGEAAALCRFIAGRLLATSVSGERPLAIIAANGVDHAIFALAAMSVGLPVAIISPAYAAPGARPWAKLKRVLDQLTPGLILADDPSTSAEALADMAEPAPCRDIRDLTWLGAMQPVDAAIVSAAAGGVGPDTIAKLLFTSGSTGAPKAVINTHLMMASNMEGLALVWPFLRDTPPVLVDWLPWNHTFGGNCCFNLALWFGGVLHIDEGKPLPAQVGATITAINSLQPNLYFNVPGGYEALLPHLEADEELARRFLSPLRFLFNAGAALPAPLKARLQALAARVLGRQVPLIGGWGSTETAPFSTVLYFDTPHAANLGVPLPGVDILLTPSGARAELRVRGPNVTPGYWRQPEATANAFDQDGFYRIGDAGRLVDVEHPEAGILFDGRIAENFKLSSGTWVNVGGLRLAVIEALQPYVSDAVVTGEGRDDVGVLIVLNPTAAEDSRSMSARIAEGLAAYNRRQIGSSTKIARFHILEEPPSRDHDELTDKGYLNQRAVLARRAHIVDGLHAAAPGAGFVQLPSKRDAS